ncbi:F-box domain-containing protein [Pleurotus pulmonarius]
MFNHDNRKAATMMPLDKLAPEILLSVASFLPSQDVRALSRTCRKLHAICEIHLYASIDFEMKDSSDASTDKRLVRFYGSLMARTERCTYVQHLSLDFSRTFTSRDHALVSAIVEALPCIRTFMFSYSNVDFSDDDSFKFSQSLRSRRAIIKSSFRTLKATILPGRQKRSPSHNTVATRRPFEERSSLLNLTWLNRHPLEASFLLSFVRLHTNIRFLHLEHATNFPKMDASILPNLESVKAPISVVLALLPGRRIQRVNTRIYTGAGDMWDDYMNDTSGNMLKEDGLDGVKVFMCEDLGDGAPGGFLPFLIEKMKSLEVLDIMGGLPIEIPTLRKTKVELLRLHHGADQSQALDLFRSVKTLQCVEWLDINVVDDGQPGWLILYTATRLYGNGKWIPHVQWKCEPGDEWLMDWKDVYWN